SSTISTKQAGQPRVLSVGEPRVPPRAPSFGAPERGGTHGSSAGPPRRAWPVAHALRRERGLASARGSLVLQNHRARSYVGPVVADWAHLRSMADLTHVGETGDVRMVD